MQTGEYVTFTAVLYVKKWGQGGGEEDYVFACLCVVAIFLFS